MITATLWIENSSLNSIGSLDLISAPESSNDMQRLLLALLHTLRYVSKRCAAIRREFGRPPAKAAKS